MKLFWNASGTPNTLATALRALAEEYPIQEGASGDPPSRQLTFLPGAADTCVVRRNGSGVTISGGTTATQLRAVGAVLADLVADGASQHEPAAFTTCGVMLDCSRNAVLRPEVVKAWLRRLALLGFNQFMLYTEDTYEIPGEEYFGFLRGRYTADELRDFDAYAARLGIEMVGCIQTLAHMEQALRWPSYAAIRDYESTMLVGEEKTYTLIGKMLDTMSGALQSRRLHIGMDEAWHLGRGAYLDRFGYQRQFNIFNDHLRRVVDMCRARGLSPMIWSDMYFSMGSASHSYYDPGTVIPPDVAVAIPREVQLVYWDYYHADKDFYMDWIGRHRALGFEPVMASGVWTWSQLWYNRQLTETNAAACIAACRETGLKELIFTMWGDDGAYCDYDSAWAGLAFVAERVYAPTAPVAALRQRFAAVCGGDYAATVAACGITGPINTAGILWDDPILGIFQHGGLSDGQTTWPALEEWFVKIRESLAPYAGQTNATGDLEHAQLLADLMARKIALRRVAVPAYAARDTVALRAVATEAMALSGVVEALHRSWRRQWMRRNRPFGFEVLQTRLAGQAARWRELAVRIGELLDGTVREIPEWDATVQKPSGVGASYRQLTSGSVIV